MFSMAIFLGASIVLLFNYPHKISIEDSRYLLSAIIQSLAAILAIVVTLTLIAVQLASQRYTPRLMKEFLTFSWFWLLLFGFSFAMILSISSLYYLEEYGGPTSVAVMGPIMMTLVSLTYLFIYIKLVIGLLSLTTIIDTFLSRINKGFFDQLSKETESTILSQTEIIDIPEDDKLVPVVDITINAIKRYDVETARIALHRIGNSYIDRISDGIVSEENEKHVSTYFFNHLRRVFNVSLRYNDEETIDELNLILRNMAKPVYEKKFTASAKRVLELLALMGEELVKEGLKVRFSTTLASLAVLGSYAIENKLETIAERVAKGLNSLGEMAIRRNMEIESQTALRYLESMITKSKKELSVPIVDQIVDYTNNLRDSIKHNTG